MTMNTHIKLTGESIGYKNNLQNEYTYTVT